MEGKYKARGDNFQSISQILLIKDVLGLQTVLGHTYVYIINKMYFAAMDLGFGIDIREIKALAGIRRI